MQNQNKGVTFRRIHGRIVPIRSQGGIQQGKPSKTAFGNRGGMSKGNSDFVKGAAIAATGAGIAYGGAQVYKKTLFRAVNTAVKAFGKTPFAAKEFASANVLSKLATGIRRTSPIIGTGLIFYGGAKALQAKSDKKFNPEKVAFISAVSGGVGVAALPSSYKFAQRTFNFGLHSAGSQAKMAKNFIIDFGKKYGPILASKLVKR